MSPARRCGVILVLFVVLVAGCSGTSEPDEEAAPTFSPAPQVSNPLGECARNTKIGLVYNAASQSALERGVTLASDQLNERGSFNYEPVLMDGAAEEAEAEAAVQELAGDREVSAVVTSARADVLEGSIQAAREADLPLLLVAASPDEVATGDGVFSLRLSAATEERLLKAAAAAELDLERLKVARTPGLIDPGSPYLVAPRAGQDPGALLRGIADIVGPKNVVGTSVYAFTDTGTLPDGAHVGVPWYVDAPESINAAFVVDFEEKYGEKPSIDAAYGYTSVLLVARAVEAACSNERPELLEKLGATKDASSVFGRFSLAKNGAPSHPMWLLKVKNGAPTAP